LHLRELALLFLRIGVTAFGGPAAHIAMMKDEVVVRRKWLTSAEFLDLLGATNLIPGPNSTEMAMHIGHRRAGWRGLVVAGVCFIGPAAIITAAMAWAYVRFGSVPRAQGILYGVKPVIIAVVVQAIWGLAKDALKTKPLMALGAACVAAALYGLNELALLVAAGALVAVSRMTGRSLFQVTPFASWKLFLVFLKIGSVLFGSGYVLLAFLRTDLVERLHWLTEKQLIDAVAVGQVTPGPVFSTATFIGYVIGGGTGAALATIGIFLPSFFFVAASGALIPRLQRSKTARSFLDGVNVASLALMVAVTWELGRTALVDIPTLVLAIVSAVLLLRFKIRSTWLVAGAACIGVIVKLA
jgi:chromate transporter